jgi:hypothetical protein
MCWACEQDRFWTEYAKYMAAKAAEANAGLAGHESIDDLAVPPLRGEGDAGAAEPGRGQAAAKEPE